ncbi:hypothetical protein D3C71_2000810 [compost metagenome]
MAAATTNQTLLQRLFCKREKLERIESISGGNRFSTIASLVFGRVRRDALEAVSIA